MDMNLHIPVSKFEFIDYNDDDFFKVRLQAIANGENLNRSDFDKDGMMASKDSFKGKPLLCAFPKNKYSDGYKIGDGHNSSEIKYDSEYGEIYRSYLDQNSERMVGYIPGEANIDIELIDGKYWMCMDALILRKYNYELVKDILNKKNGKSKRNNKRISVEIEVLSSHMRKHETEDYDVEVIDMFKGMGVTILFDDTQEAVVGANLKAFSESEQYNKFKSFMQYNFSHQEFVDKDEIGAGEKIAIKRDKISDTPWGDVDKTELYKKALNASNYKAVVRFIYAKVEDGWEDSPSDKLKYPIGQISDGEAFYNKGGLSSALGYSKTVGDSDVTAKIERIRKRLGIEDEEESEEFAVEKNTDILDNEVVVEEYPNQLEMESSTEKEFGLTLNQKRELIEIAMADIEKEADGENGHNGYCGFWVKDLDDEYAYIEFYYDDYRTYRIKYVIDEEAKTATLDMDTKEEVINAGYEVVGAKPEETLAEDKTSDEEMANTEGFDVTTSDDGGVDDKVGTEALAPVAVSFTEEEYNKAVTDLLEANEKMAKYEADITELKDKLCSYMVNELLKRFEDISVDSNITVVEKADWKERINRSEFESEDELIEKFGGFVFKKNFENKMSTYSSETVTEKSNSKKSYEVLIDQYMTNK